MKIIQIITSVLILELLVSCSLFRTGKKSQTKEQLFTEGLEAYRSGNFDMADDYLKKAIQIDSVYVQAYLLLSDVAAELENDDLRLCALKKVLSLEADKYKIAHKYASDIYQKQGNFEEASFHLTKYLDNCRHIDTAAVNLRLKNLEKARLLVENKIIDANIRAFDDAINTKYDEYWPFPSTDDSTIYFTRLIKPQGEQPFERLFYCERKDKGWDTALQLKIGDVQEVNEGTITMTANENLIFFTACGRSDGYGSCDIYFMIKTSAKWLGPFNAGENINTVNWDAQPSVSATGNILFWTSTRPGGQGKKDIWYCTIEKDSKGIIKFGEAMNAGSGVNTLKDEYSPFIHADNRTLYFASTGHYGMGKSDMFVSKLTANFWGRAKNLGYPINSIDDDDGLVVSPSAHLTLFSSNRHSSSINKSKDIYYFDLPNDVRPNMMGYLKGFVYSRETNQKINVKIELSKLNTKETQIIESDKENGYLTVIEAGQKYALNVSLPGFLFYSKHFDYDNPGAFNNATIQNIYLEPIEIGATVILNNIFFDFDSAKINAKSESELTKVIEFMKQNPNVQIEVLGHTDNVGNKNYNFQLSTNRAKGIATYLSKYIDESRITYIGFGDEKPIADNDNAAGRRKNRRSEIRISNF